MAYVVYEPNRPQENAQPVHGSGAEVQDHDPGTSQLSSETVSRTAPPGSEPSEDDGRARPRWSSLRQQLPRHRASQQSTQEMLENATLLTQFGKEDTAAKSQSHAARIQVTLENAEVTEIKCAVFRALTRLRVTEMKEFDAIDRIETQTTDENNEKSAMRTETGCSYTATKDTDATARSLRKVSRDARECPPTDGWKPIDRRTHCSVKVQVLLCRRRQISKASKW